MRARRAGVALAMLGTGLGASCIINLWRWPRDKHLARRVRAERSRPLPHFDAAPLVSVLVAAWNEAEYLERHIAGILALTYPHIEYVLCAGGNDGTLDVARRFEHEITLLQQQAGEGKQAALRRCLAAAHGAVVFLTDADSIVDDASFVRTLEPVIQGTSAASTGDSRPVPLPQPASALAEYRRGAEAYTAAHASDAANGVLGRNCAVRRSALTAAGDFQEDVRSGTDYHLAKSLLRAGLTIRHVRGSAVGTRFPQTYDDYAQRQRRWLRNLVLQGPKFGAPGEAVRSLMTSLIGLGMLALPLASFVAGPWPVVLWAVAVAHGSMSKLRYLAFARLVDGEAPFPGVALAMRAVPVTLMEFAAWATPLLDYVVASRRTSW